jgi:molybdopterin converting factor small subunit
MNVRLKLYATLSDYLPADARRDNTVVLDVAPDTTIDQVIDRYRLPPRLTHLVLVNGVFVAPVERPSHVLQEGDVLAIWPPIAGG